MATEPAATVTEPTATVTEEAPTVTEPAATATEEAPTVKVQPEVARREVKREARPDPNKPGWGLSIGQEVSKAPGNRASQE